MATIFTRPVLPDEKILVLQPREALLIPFEVGEWRELTLGINFSFTSVGADLNGDPSVEFSVSSPSGAAMYFGIKESTDKTPWSGNGVSFIGTQNFSIGGTFTPRAAADGSMAGGMAGCVFFPNYNSGLVVPNGVVETFPSNFHMSGSATGYCASMMIKMGIRNRGISGQFVSVSNPVVRTVESPSVDQLKSYQALFSNPGYLASGYWTSDSTSTGIVKAIPDFRISGAHT